MSSSKVCLDGEWYDLDTWAKHHPGGKRILEQFHGFDATEAFYSLHSKSAVKMLKNRRSMETKEIAIDPHPTDKALRKLSEKLEADGFFNRTVWGEMKVLLPIVLMVVWGTMYASVYPLLATLLIGVAMQQAGWLGHDMTHARNSPYCEFMLRFVSGWINGFDRNWWSEKHNTHHVLTNHITLDPDIHNQPFLFLWAPPKSLDHHLRRYQHMYFLPLYSALFLSWRIQSFTFAWANRDYKTLFTTILPSYLWLLYLPWAVSAGALLVSGLLVAIVVTMSHESEDMLFEREPSYALNQFRCTRDIVCPDPITEFLFGGMQYQLEHHLFPTLPRYKYPQMVKIVKQFAKENNIEYKSDGLGTMLVQHYKTLRRNAMAAARNTPTTDALWASS